MKSLFEPSKNCHCIEPAHRAAFIIDGEAYFQALHEALCLARRSIFIVGWDLHSEVRLLRSGEKGGYPQALGDLLNALVKAQPKLQIYLLGWDFSMIYAMEREFFPRYKLKWRAHRRIHFSLDGHHPVGGSQHQKLVVIDDALAFAGGLDVSQWRWDTPEHLIEDDRRIDPSGKPYPPFHDIQMAVDGPAAMALSEMVRERWTRSEGVAPVVSARQLAHDVWPPSLRADFHDIQVAIARTLPAYRYQRQVEEVRQLYLDSIAAAQRLIYIENQYFSAHCIGEALVARLQASDGPEVVIVMPEKTGGWLEQHTMDVLRGHLVARLRAADLHDRLRFYFPRLAVDPHCALMVHAKVMVIDDTFLRVGSSNLSNRSMGLDSECDLAIAADAQDEGLRKSISGIRVRLLSEHLGREMADVARALNASNSVIAAIESLRHGQRTLCPLSATILPEIDSWEPESELFDPEKPVSPDELLDYFVSPRHQPAAFRHAFKLIAMVAIAAGLAAMWRWSPLGDYVDLENARLVAEWIRQQPLAPLLVMGVYVLGGIVALPVTLMIIATILFFGTWLGLLYALAGSWLSAVAVFGIGRWLGRDVVRRFAGSLLNRLSQKLSESGFLAVVTMRIIPVAPFSVINLIAGVSAIRWRDFALGTLVGMLPGVIAVSLLADRIAASLYHPDFVQITLLLASIALVGLGLVGLRKRVRRQQAQKVQ